MNQHDISHLKKHSVATSVEILPAARSRVRTRNPLKVWWMVEIFGYRILLRKNLPPLSIYRIRISQHEWLLCKKSEYDTFRYKG